jgi:hypothetical protein
VLEHVADDRLALRNIHKALCPGGRAVILTPHGQEIFGALDEALGHYRRYSHDGLRAAMEDTGFRVERILDFNRISRPAWYLNGRLLKRRKIGGLQLRMFDRTVGVWRKADGWLPWAPTSIIAIAEKR